MSFFWILEQKYYIYNYFKNYLLKMVNCLDITLYNYYNEKYKY